jgi:hypothetical protein
MILYSPHENGGHGAHHCLFHPVHESLEHFRVFPMPFQALAFPLCHPAREALHSRKDLHEKRAGQRSVHEPVHQVVNPVDEGVVGFVDWGPGVDRGKHCRGCGAMGMFG